MTAMVEASGLSLRYGDVLALDGVSFQFPGPGIYGVLGRNGSGKTSLLSLLAGFRRPSAGVARVNGSPVFEHAVAMRQVCLIREGGDTVNGSERVSAALEFAGRMRPDWDGAYAAHLLERFDLSRDRKVGQLSRGQRAALAVTLGLASRAPVTMFDEAYLGMDAPSRYVFYDELLRDYMDHPRAVIVSTHLIEEVSSLFGEVLILDRGRVLLHEDADAFRTRGATVTGPRSSVERFTSGMRVLEQRHLGPTASTAIYGELDDAALTDARHAGLEIGPLALQDLFVHLTAPKEMTDDRPIEPPVHG